MFKCKSSNLDWADYDTETKTLEICFKHTGNCYKFRNVPKTAYEAFERAESHGRHFYKHIRENFKSEKQDNPNDEL